MSSVVAYLIIAVMIMIAETIRGKGIREIGILSLGLGLTLEPSIVGQIVLLSAILVSVIGLSDSETLLLFKTGVIGLLIVGSATELLKLYIGIEIVSLSFYILAGRERNKMESTEAGMKYFVQGALSSGILLMGITIVYAQTGTTDIELVAGGAGGSLWALHEGATGVAPVLGAVEAAGAAGVTVSIAMIIAGILFKLGAAPLHMWVPDVYEGAATIITTFFAIVPKIAYFGLLMKLVPSGATGGSLLLIGGILSIVIGSLGAINQTKIKRLLAYSAIGHVGFMLLGVGIGTQVSIQAAIIYMVLYIVMTLNSFTIVKSQGITKIAELRGMSRRNGVIGMTMGLGMMSIAGVPPLAGFYNKYLVILSTVEVGQLELAIVAVLVSVVSSYYYIRIIRYMYFKDKAEITVHTPTIGIYPAIVLGMTTYVILTIMFYPQVLLVVTSI